MMRILNWKIITFSKFKGLNCLFLGNIRNEMSFTEMF